MTDSAVNSAVPTGSTQATWESAVRWLRGQREYEQLVRDAYYDDPLDACAQRYWASNEWAAVREWLPKGGRALELGAGRGIASYAMAREGFAVVALEPDESALVGAEAIRGLAATTGSNIEVVVGVSENLPLPSASFDLVLARAVLHHTRDLQAACREVMRVLKPGGRFVVLREHVLSAQADLPQFLDAHPLHRLYGGENAFLLSHYVGCLESAGLTVRKCLNPFQSAMNFAPRTEAQLRSEILDRALRIGLLRRLVSPVFEIPGVWPAVFHLLGRLDRRPGRHYSFICDKPA